MVERAFVNQSIVKCYPIAREFAEECIFHHETFFVSKVVDDIILFNILDFNLATFCKDQCILFERASAAASHDFYVGVDGEHALLSTPLCDDFQLVGVFFVSIAKILDVLLRVDRLSRREE